VKKHKNIFITFEGGEGAGKSTVAKIVKKKLEKNGQPVFLTREPGGTNLKFSEDVRKIIMKHEDIDPITELLLFEAARREHITKKIIPNLKKGNLVISDRFADSTIVYQGIVKKIGEKIATCANDIAVGDNYPDLVFIFDIDPKIGFARIKNNKRQTNRFDNEGLEFHKKIRESYLKISNKNKDKYKLLDATKKPEIIADEIVEIIKKYNG